MSAPWWGKEATPSQRDMSTIPGAAPSDWPVLTEETRDAVYREWLNRILSYTPEWTNRSPNDAGIALGHLFSEEMEPVLQRINQLPENAFIEFLKVGGIEAFPPTPAEALLQFSISDSATQSVYIPQGFQVGASPANGGNMVIFETNDDLYAAPGTIQEVYAFDSGLYQSIDISTPGTPFQPFGTNPRTGLAFFIGLEATPNETVGPQISLGFQVQGPSGQAPIATGGVVPLPAPLSPLLRWSVLNGREFQDAQVVNDETNGLVQSGVVTLNLPDTWNPGIPPGCLDTTPLLWLRLDILYGSYPVPPVLTDVELNVVRSTAVQTFYNEVLMPVAGTNGSVMLLSQTPVIPNSLSLQVDDTGNISFNPSNGSSNSSSNGSSNTANGSSAGNGSPQPTIPTASIWTQVDDLLEFGPTDQVYELDSATGEVTFGDDVHGMAVPQGYRNVVALSYQVGGGSAGAVAAGAVNTLITSVPFVSGVTNPWPATGGTDAEPPPVAMVRGPKEMRARGRAVAPADYETLALHATGALVARAQAVPDFHPSFAGTPIPGVVCVFVVPPERGDGPPIPDEDTLRAVSNYLSSNAAPAGVEVVAAAPVYHTVRVEVSLVIDPAQSRGTVVTDALDQIDFYLDPITGGDDGQGWPFGGTLSNIALVRYLLKNVDGVTAVPSLRFVVDGVRYGSCTDVPIPANTLVWPQDHQVLALGPEEEP